MPKMTPAQAKAARAARAAGGDEDAITDAVADATVDEDTPADATIKTEKPATPRRKPSSGTEKGTPTPKPAPKSSSLFVSLDDVEDFVNLVYWGREGSGKTSAALSAANLGKVLVINAEGGLKKPALKKRGINTDNVFVYPNPGETLTFEGLRDALFQVKTDLMNEPGSWHTIIIDSVSEVSAALVSAVSDDRIEKARKRGATVDTFDSFFVDRGDYGTSGKMLRTILRMCRDLQCHFITTALERRDVDEQTSKVTYGPAIPPGIQSDLLGYVDLVLYTREADEEKPFYRAMSKRAGSVRAKDRFDSLPVVLVEPSFERVLAYLNEELDADTDPLQEKLNTPEPEKKTRQSTRKTPAKS